MGGPGGMSHVEGFPMNSQPFRGLLCVLFEGYPFGLVLRVGMCSFFEGIHLTNDLKGHHQEKKKKTQVRLPSDNRRWPRQAVVAGGGGG